MLTMTFKPVKPLNHSQHYHTELQVVFSPIQLQSSCRKFPSVQIIMIK